MRIVAYIFSFKAFLILVMGVLYKVQNWSGAKNLLYWGYLVSLFAGVFILLHKLKEKKKTEKKLS